MNASPKGRSTGQSNAALVCGFLLAAMGRQLAAQQPPPETTIRVEVKQVLVPCVVTDRKGNYLKNLNETDFRVYENDVEQKIVAFSSNVAEASRYFRPQGIEPGKPFPEAITSSIQGGPIPRNTYVFCLDTLHSAFGSYERVRRALQRLLSGGLPFDAQYALVTLGRQPTIVQNLTRDPGPILASLTGKQFKGAMKESEATPRAAEETELTTLLNSYTRKCAYGTAVMLTTAGTTDECRRDWRTIELWTNARTEARRPLELNFLASLRSLVESLGTVPGRRTIILLTDGFSLQPGRELYAIIAAFVQLPIMENRNRTRSLEPELEQLLWAAQMRDVSFYTLSSKGVYTIPLTGFDADQSARRGSWQVARTGPDLVMSRQAIEIDNQGVLKQLAEETGGDFYHNSNDFLRGLQQTLDDGEAYYLLAYVPTNLVADGKFHKIRVEVDESSAVVRAKKGYWAPAVGKAN